MVPPEISAALFPALAVREPHFAVDRAEPEALVATALEGRKRLLLVVAVVWVGEVYWRHRLRKGMNLDEAEQLTW